MTLPTIPTEAFGKPAPAVRLNTTYHQLPNGSVGQYTALYDFDADAWVGPTDPVAVYGPQVAAPQPETLDDVQARFDELAKVLLFDDAKA